MQFSFELTKIYRSNRVCIEIPSSIFDTTTNGVLEHSDAVTKSIQPRVEKIFKFLLVEISRAILAKQRFIDVSWNFYKFIYIVFINILEFLIIEIQQLPRFLVNRSHVHFRKFNFSGCNGSREKTCYTISSILDSASSRSWLELLGSFTWKPYPTE